MAQFRFGNYRCQCLSPLISFPKLTMPKESCRSNNYKPQVSYSATYESHTLLILSHLLTMLLFGINCLSLLQYGIIVSQLELALKCRFCKYRIFFHSIEDNDWWSKSNQEMLNHLFVSDFITKFLRKMCLSKPGSFFQMKHCLNLGFKSQMCYSKVLTLHFRKSAVADDCVLWGS